MTQTRTEVRPRTHVQAINQALRQETERDPKVFIIGGGVTV